MKHRFLLALPLLTLLAGCGSGGDYAETRQINLNEDAVVSLGETVELSNEAARVRLETITEDSRCPPYADCVQAGQLRIAVSVIGLKGSFTQESKLPYAPTELPAPPASGYFVALIDAPLPGTGRTSPALYWPITIRVSKVP